MSYSASIQGVRFKETVGERCCFCQKATLAEFVVYLDPLSWPWAGHLTWASEGFSHQCRAGGGLRWATVTPKEKRSLAITKSFCCDRLTWNSPTQNRTFLTSLCESFFGVWVRSKYRQSYTGSSSLTSIGSGRKAVTVPDFHLKPVPTVCLPAAGWQAEQGAGCWRVFCVYHLLFFMITLYGRSQLLNSYRDQDKVSLLLLFLLYNNKQSLLRLETFVFSAH